MSRQVWKKEDNGDVKWLICFVLGFNGTTNVQMYKAHDLYRLPIKASYSIHQSVPSTTLLVLFQMRIEELNSDISNLSQNHSPTQPFVFHGGHFCDKQKFTTKPIFVFALISILKTTSFATISLSFSRFNAASLSERLCTNVGDKKSADNEWTLTQGPAAQEF